MTWLADKDREDQKRFNMIDTVPTYTFLFQDTDGSTFRKSMKNGTQHEWAKKHGFKFLRIV